MRRVGHLFERIVAPENLRLAFHRAALELRPKPRLRDSHSVCEGLDSHRDVSAGCCPAAS